MKLLLLLILTASVLCTTAQANDFFLLRKSSGKTIRSFYKGSYISLITNDKDRYSGYIKKITRDSVWIEYRQVLTGMTMIGGTISDTITYEAMKYAVKDIAYIQKEEKGLQQAVPAAILKIGGAGYILLHTVNGLIQKDKINVRNISIAAGAYLTGVLLNNLRKDYYYIGKRFRIQYIALSDNSPE